MECSSWSRRLPLSHRDTIFSTDRVGNLSPANRDGEGTSRIPVEISVVASRGKSRPKSPEKLRFRSRQTRWISGSTRWFQESVVGENRGFAVPVHCRYRTSSLRITTQKLRSSSVWAQHRWPFPPRAPTFYNSPITSSLADCMTATSVDTIWVWVVWFGVGDYSFSFLFFYFFVLFCFFERVIGLNSHWILLKVTI